LQSLREYDKTWSRKMIEAVVAFSLLYMWYIGGISFLFFCWLIEDDAHEWVSTIYTVACLALAYYIVPTLWVYAAYPFIGLLWTFFKYDRFCARKRKEYDTHNERFLSEIDPNRVKVRGMLTNWLVNWPLSLGSWLVADALDYVVEQILKLGRIIYRKIGNRHI